MKKLHILFLFLSSFALAQKQVYIPRFITNEGMDLNDPNSQWCYCRSAETDNYIIFWEQGFGDDPSTNTGDYYVNMDALKDVAEASFAMYTDSLKFAKESNSIVDTYKQMIFILYSTEWAAYGSGQDDLVGTLHVNPAAANINTVLAHEIGHSFQYIAGIDGLDGYRYGFGPNGSGGNGFWEQCANWMSFKVYPERQFTSHDFNGYIRKNHKHILHEEPRYQNYFIQDYWIYKQGWDFLGRMWRESYRPEDPVETYKRLTSISQSEFNDEMYEHAALLTTWDIPHIRDYGANFINSRSQVAMTEQNDGSWTVDSSVCIENYGYNSIKLHAPLSATTLSLDFTGLAGTAGYRSLNVNQGGWRFGFVALLKDGTRVYSDVKTANMSGTTNPTESLSFDCPDNVSKLWLVVSGSPQEHWRHEWDDDDTNDEQWPYQVSFTNTNLVGHYDGDIGDVTLNYDVQMDPSSDYTSQTVYLDSDHIAGAFRLTIEEVKSQFGSTITYAGINSDGSLNYNSTANAPGHWFDQNGETVAWGGDAYIFSELNINAMTANVGQYPDRSASGDTYTIEQALIYQPTSGDAIRATLVFNVVIGGTVTTTLKSNDFNLSPNPTSGIINLSQETSWEVTTVTGEQILTGTSSTIDLTNYADGQYFVKCSHGLIPIIKH